MLPSDVWLHLNSVWLYYKTFLHNTTVARTCFQNVVPNVCTHYALSTEIILGAVLHGIVRKRVIIQGACDLVSIRAVAI